MKVKYKNKYINLPDFLIIGAAKSGTTSLFNYLVSREDVFMPRCKESWFFSYKDNPPNFVTPDALKVVSRPKEYIKLFSKAREGQILGEASLSYMYEAKKTISNIKEFYGRKYKDLKIIVILRDPAERAWSNYMHLRRDVQEPLSFSEAIKPDTIKQRMEKKFSIFYDYLGLSLYSRNLSFYLNNFSQVKVVFFSDLRAKPQELLRELESFLALDSEFVYKNQQKIYNPSGEFNNKLKIFSPFYSWYSNPANPFRRLVGKILPLSVKGLVDAKIRKVFLKRKRIPDDLRKKLIKDVFSSDINDLMALLPQHREKIKKWFD